MRCRDEGLGEVEAAVGSRLAIRDWGLAGMAVRARVIVLNRHRVKCGVSASRLGRCHDGLEVRVEGRLRDHSRNLEVELQGLKSISVSR